MAERAVQKIKCARARYCIHPVATTKLVPLEFFFRTSFFPFFKFPLLYQRARYWCTHRREGDEQRSRDLCKFSSCNKPVQWYVIIFMSTRIVRYLGLSIKSGKKSACAVKQNYKKRVGVSSFAVKKHDSRGKRS